MALPGSSVRIAVRDEPCVIAASVFERIVIGELEPQMALLARDHFARQHFAELRVTRRVLDPEDVELAHGLGSPLRFHRPLSDQQARRHAGFGVQAHRDPGDFGKPLIQILIHEGVLYASSTSAISMSVRPRPAFCVQFMSNRTVYRPASACPAGSHENFGFVSYGS